MDFLKFKVGQRLAKSGLTWEDIQAQNASLEVAQFHRKLTNESVLFSPIYQAEIFGLTEAQIRARIKISDRFFYS